jgi:hypothetical protein
MSEPTQSVAPSDVATEAVDTLNILGAYLTENWVLLAFPVYCVVIILITQALKGLFRALLPKENARPLIAILPIGIGGASGGYVIPVITQSVPWMIADPVISVGLGIMTGGVAQYMYHAHRDGSLGRLLKWTAKLTLAVMQMSPLKIPQPLIDAIEGLTVSARTPIDADLMSALQAMGNVEVVDDKLIITPHPETPDDDSNG